MKKEIPVTGGFGFIGGHLIELLSREKANHVHVVDNLSNDPIILDILLGGLKHIRNARSKVFNMLSGDLECRD